MKNATMEVVVIPNQGLKACLVCSAGTFTYGERGDQRPVYECVRDFTAWMGQTFDDCKVFPDDVAVTIKGPDSESGPMSVTDLLVAINASAKRVNVLPPRGQR